jgi:uncharacterized membrane protein
MADAENRAAADTPLAPAVPVVRGVSFEDLARVLRLGWQDYKAAPAYGIFFGAVYAVGGLILVSTVLVLGAQWLAYPLVIGFALIGPFVATGLYEVSRRREAGRPLSWSGVLTVVWNQRRRELGWMAFVMLFIFWVWMYQARTLFAVFFGFSGFATMQGFLHAVFTTSNGWMFLLTGHIVGAIISMVLFTLTVVSCPLLLDRDADFVTAMITSVRVVTGSPGPMIAWGLFVVVCVVLSALPLFLGFLVTLPVFGHTTWHLYRTAVAPPAPPAAAPPAE